MHNTNSFPFNQDFAVRSMTMTFTIHEYFLTLPSEIQLFWSRKLSAVSALFMVNRYLALVLAATNYPGPTLPHISDTACTHFRVAFVSLNVLQYLLWAAYSALRTYALASNRFAAALVFLLSNAPFALNAALLYWYHGVVEPMFGCMGLGSLPPSVNAVQLVLLARIPLMAADLIVIGVIGLSAYRFREINTDVLSRRRPSLSSVMVRDGAIYFVVLFALNVLHVFSTVFAIIGNPTDVGGPTSSLVTVFTNPLTSILVSRSLINLRHADMGITESALSQMSNLVFCSSLPPQELPSIMLPEDVAAEEHPQSVEE